MVIAIHVNGESHELAEACSLQQLLVSLGHGEKRCAVERNGEIVPRSQHANTQLVAGDRLEVVVAVGGG